MIYKNIFGRIVLHILSLLMTMSQKKNNLVLNIGILLSHT